jgi:hypothetical protein
MTLLDRIIGPLALLAFAGFLGILIWNVPKFGLVAVSVIAVLLGAFDFARSAVIRQLRERADAKRGR